MYHDEIKSVEPQRRTGLWIETVQVFFEHIYVIDPVSPIQVGGILQTTSPIA